MENGYFSSYSVSQSGSSCKTVLTRIYFSKCMQIIYTFLIVLCILSIILNFVLQFSTSSDFSSVPSIVLGLEFSICAIISSEISLRLYIQIQPLKCCFSTIADLTVTVLCIVGLVLTLQKDALDELGDIISNSLLIIRNILFMVRLCLVVKHQDDTQVPFLRLNSEQNEEEMANYATTPDDKRKSNASIDTWLEDEDEQDMQTAQPIWKGKKLTSS